MTRLHAVLGTSAMDKADTYAMEHGISGQTLMSHAAQSVVDEILKRYAARPVHVLCGPGNNGGDGYVIACLLKNQDWPVTVYQWGPKPEPDSLCSWARQEWSDPVKDLDEFRFEPGTLVVDALLGAGLSRPLEEPLKSIAEASQNLDGVLVSVDIPSGLDGDADIKGPVFNSDLTVTFHRLKPGHLLHPGSRICGHVICRDIGIPEGWDSHIDIDVWHNHPDLWIENLKSPDSSEHKHSRGRLSVISGPVGATAAARMSALSGLKSGAGLVTLHCQPDALEEASRESWSVMTRGYTPDSVNEDIQASRPDALVFGMGAGKNEQTRDITLNILKYGVPVVLDADALSAFEKSPEALFEELHESVILTPHEGEFSRLFPDIDEGSGNKIDRVRQAAQRAGCHVLLKGPDTVIASPEGAVIINTHATPHLATAGSGDILAGMIGGFLAQQFDSLLAAAAATWIQGEAGLRLGPGLLAEELPGVIPDILYDLQSRQKRKSALSRLQNPA